MRSGNADGAKGCRFGITGKGDMARHRAEYDHDNETCSKIGDILYSPCQEKNEQLRNVNSYNMIDNTPFRKHTYP
jgi:hypothetical protein